MLLNILYINCLIVKKNKIQIKILLKKGKI